MGKEKLRSEIADCFKWDANNLVKDFDTYEKEVLEQLDRVVSFQGKILESANNLLEFYNAEEELNRKSEYLYMYAHLCSDVDTTNMTYKGLKMRTDKMMETISDKTSFIVPELLEADFSKIEEFIKEIPELKQYRFDLEKIFRYKEHTLSKSEEEIVTKAFNAFGTGDDAFTNLDNTDIDLGMIEVDGKQVELTHSNFIKYMNDDNRDVRSQAFEKMYAYFKNHINTIAACLKGNIKENFFASSVKKYDNP